MSAYKPAKENGVKKAYIIAELACGYEGDVKLLKEWINKLALIGPDAIKLHIHYADDYITKDHNLYPFYKKMEVDYDIWPDIFQLVKEKNMDVLIMPNELKGLAFMENKDVDGVVLHSANLLDYNMINKLKDCKKPIFIGVGGTYIDEIEKVLSMLKEKDIILMIGFQNYPTNVVDHKFSYINMYSNTFNLPVGFDDHVEGGSLYSFIMPIIARSKGAVAIEKHVTDDRNLKRTDYQSALEFDEFKKFLDLFRSMEETLYDYPLVYSEQEMAARNLIKKQMVAYRDLKAKTRIKRGDIAFKRTIQKSMPPSEYCDVIGKICKKDIKKDAPIKMSYIEW
jgi:sialic acid synthase SpsE